MKKTILTAVVLAATLAGTGAVYAQGEGRERPDFATLDADGDGVITMEELQAQGSARFAERDINGDGALSAEELLVSESERAAERVAKMIERADENGDGLLQQEELQARGGDRMTRMFERVDADGNGGISEDEFDTAKERRAERRGNGNGPRGDGSPGGDRG